MIIFKLRFFFLNLELQSNFIIKLNSTKIPAYFSPSLHNQMLTSYITISTGTDLIVVEYR